MNEKRFTLWDLIEYVVVVQIVLWLFKHITITIV